MENENQNKLKIYSINIGNCFEYYQINEFKEDEQQRINSIYCNKCQIYSSFSFKKELYSIPEILIIILKRKNTGINIKFDITEEINLGNYIKAKNKASLEYKLISFIGNTFESSFNNIISYYRSPIDDKWYKYDNNEVIKSDILVNEIKDSMIPYIIFYQKK